jgi:hypothetical protein
VSSLQPTDSHVINPQEVRRLTGQNAAILARLQRGPASRWQLQNIACNPTARVSDLRKAGYVVRCAENAEGHSVYTLIPTANGHDLNNAPKGRMF